MYRTCIAKYSFKSNTHSYMRVEKTPKKRVILNALYHLHSISNSLNIRVPRGSDVCIY